MNKNTLRDLIKSKIEAKTGGTIDGKSLDAMEGLADAIVTHIQTTGVVTVVTTCGAGAGSGTGTVA